MYTVPKHMHALSAQARTTDYFRLIGYQEEDGKLESTEAYLVHVVAYVKLYAAMIQTDIKGVWHPHGLAEGWKWLAMFLNTLPATTATAFALHACFPQDGWFFTSQEIWITVRENSRCNIRAVRTSFERTTLQSVEVYK
jgi:nucleoporin GLE1